MHLQNGLRHNDYSRYHKYCTNKLKTLKKSLKLSAVQTKTKKFELIAIKPEIIENDKYFYIVFLNCERSWAYSMSLKQVY